VAHTTQVCTAQLPAFPALDSRPDAIQPVPASVGRLVQRNVLEIEPTRTPPPPTARFPDGQSCCWLFGLLLFDVPVPESICSPLTPVFPCGPCGPAGPVGPCGIWPGAKSRARSEAFFTFAELTALFFSCAVPTLLRGNAIETAKAAPLSEIASARQATTIAGEGGRRRMSRESVRPGAAGSPQVSAIPLRDARMQVRFARHTTRLEELVGFYRDGLGLREIGRFAGHEGYDGVFLAVPGTDAHLEFTTGGPHEPPTPNPETLLVLYLGSDEAVAQVRRRVGTEPIEPANPYWQQHGVTLADPDGFGVVLVARSWPES
jgi:catechol 2,3-dioxygenase-like lactoylglutathione lyase family enzyme